MYPHYTKPPNWIRIRDFKDSFSRLTKTQLDTNAVRHSIVGRVRSIRDSSRNLWFLDLEQEGHRSQVILNRSSFNDPSHFEQCKVGLSRGHFIEASGLVTKSLTDELSLKADSIQILSSCQINLPDKGLDTENRMRFRHLDMLSNGDFIKVLKERSSLIRRVREYLDGKGFVEVETPILSPKYGGAAARPFTTQHIHDIHLNMRIAPELHLKQLVIGGLDRVYELGKVFRNEGFDASHNPEFTMCEFYEAYNDCQGMMKRLEGLLEYVGEGKIFKAPFKSLEICQVLEERLGIQNLETILECEETSKRLLLEAANKQGKTLDASLSLPKILDKLIEMFVEPCCSGPTFLTGHPMIMSPLAKAKPSKSMTIADRFELFVDGHELANGFAEQNDPELQAAAFQKQTKERQLGDAEVPPADLEFLEAMKAGMPPTAGCGIGIDRLTMLLTGKSHIRDVLAFPMLRPKATE